MPEGELEPFVGGLTTEEDALLLLEDEEGPVGLEAAAVVGVVAALAFVGPLDDDGADLALAAEETVLPVAEDVGVIDFVDEGLAMPDDDADADDDAAGLDNKEMKTMV